jgi:hypothetical protein
MKCARRRTLRQPVTPHYLFLELDLILSEGRRTCTKAQTAQKLKGRERQKLQLPHDPPRHEKNADTEPDGEQHSEHRANHPVAPAAAITTLAAAADSCPTGWSTGWRI